MARPAVIQEQQQAAERQAAAQVTVKVWVPGGDQRLAVEAGARAWICTQPSHMLLSHR